MKSVFFLISGSLLLSANAAGSQATPSAHSQHTAIGEPVSMAGQKYASEAQMQQMMSMMQQMMQMHLQMAPGMKMPMGNGMKTPEPPTSTTPPAPGADQHKH